MRKRLDAAVQLRLGIHRWSTCPVCFRAAGTTARDVLDRSAGSNRARRVSGTISRLVPADHHRTLHVGVPRAPCGRVRQSETRLRANSPTYDRYTSASESVVPGHVCNRSYACALTRNGNL
jgi:hypothetical protein